MTKEEIITEVGKPILRPIGIIQLIFLFAFIFSPLIWIWYGWNIAWKICLTGLIGVIIFYGIYKFLKKIIIDSVNEVSDIQAQNNIKSTFQEKIEKLKKDNFN
jgi:hypothetical protein